MAVQTSEEICMVVSGGGKEGLEAKLSQLGGLGDPAWPVRGPSLDAVPGSAETLPD